jgi:glycogen operon protein
VLEEFTAESPRCAPRTGVPPPRFFQGRPIHGSNIEDIVWLRPDGEPMTDQDWHVGFARSLGVFLNGHGIPERDPMGRRVVDDSFLLLFNAHHQAVPFTLPGEAYGRAWEVELDTADPLKARAARRGRDAKPGGRLRIVARSLLVLRKRF